MDGKKLDDRADKPMMTASTLSCSSQSKDSDPKVRTCSNAAIRIYSAFIPTSMRTSNSSHMARAADERAQSERRPNEMYD